MCFRKQDNESIRVSTLCHNPQYPVENVMVPKYNTSQCIMVRQHNEDGIFYICGCVNEQECNDKLVFKNQTNGEYFQWIIVCICRVNFFYAFKEQGPKPELKEKPIPA